ncbi:hypothetical protein [Rubrivivax gelatinosus]|uniref:Uncharacterized protein n=2 Tax=Rubrivivax gelatinosus TaxID=28068 RepID=I0HPQ8_RUBGI|nr:hypothetical protein [Rubrivivax gelatinosus]MBG6081587.1 hypothetical protein [Rubrivivax gelatinosus]BAL94995.1 hypothetical protein RGE_16540 [Rubrivivax gelatinosus IL144]
MTPAARPDPAPRPEHWRLDAGDRADALLVVPADARRERRFEISVTMSVRPRPGAREPWHELRVLADGELQWSRRIATDPAGRYDGLDYRFRRDVPVGRELRLQAFVECGGGERLRLTIEADEDA